MEVTILLVILCSFPKPKVLTAVMAALLLLRPNERFECFVSYPKVIFPILAISLFLFTDKESRTKQLSFDKPLLYFIAVISVQTVVLHSSDIVRNFEFLIVGVLLYYAVNMFSNEQGGVKLLCYAIVCSCLFITGEAVYYHFTEPVGSQIWRVFHGGNVGRLQAWGNWANANETAFISCLGVANVLYLCANLNSKLFYTISLTLIPFFAFVVFLTGSRAGLATLVLIFIPMALLLGSNIGKAIVVMAIVAAVLLSSVYAPERVDLEASSEDRFDLRYGAIKLFQQNPIKGVGFQRIKYDLGGMAVHNTYLQAIAETGVIGASFLFYFLYKLGTRIYFAIMYFKNKKTFNLNVALVTGQYVSSLFYFLWGNQLLSVLFFLILAQINTVLDLNGDGSENI